MAGTPSAWIHLVEGNRGLRFIDATLRGAGQVIFQDNPITGLLFIAAIAWGAYASGAPDVILGALAGLIVATATAAAIEADAMSLRQGLFGFNGILVGVAVPNLIADTATMWVLLVIGSAVSTIAMLAVSNVMRTWGTPALTFPFVLTTWFLALAAYSFGGLTIAGMDPPSLAASPGAAEARLALVPLLEAWLKGPAQVFLIDNWISGVLVVIGLLVASPWAAVFALAGSAVAIGLSLFFGATLAGIAAGLYGFSPVLTAVAVGCVFYIPSVRVAAYALLATLFTVIVQAALDAAVSPLGVPTFTAPFVFVTWLFLLPKANLKPHPHQPIESGLFSTNKEIGK